MQPARPLLALALLAPALAGCLGPAALEAQAGPEATAAAFLPRLFAGHLYERADVPSADGVAVRVHVWRPDPAKFQGQDAGAAQAPVPVIAHVSPYHRVTQGATPPGGATFDFLFQHLVPRGYAVALVDLPGTAGSGGCWDFMGPSETAAAASAIDWLGAEPWSNGKVGTFGVSYDGMTQIMALSKNPEAYAAAIPTAPLTHAYAGVYMNGVPYSGFWGGAYVAYQVLIPHVIALSPTPAAAEDYAGRLPDQPACAAENLRGGVLNLGDYNEYYAARDFRAGAKDVDVPTFFIQGFLDVNVKPDNAFPYVNDLAGDKVVWLGQWPHTNANATHAGREDLYLAMTRFYDRHLKGVDNGVEAEYGFHVQDSEGRWRREAAWPPADAQPVAMRLADGALAAPDATGSGASFLDDAGASDADPCLIGTGCVDLPAAPASDALPTWIFYESEPLAAPLHLAGAPVLHLNVSSSGPRGQVVAYLADCPAEGHDCDLVLFGAMNLLHRGGLERGEPLAPGETVAVSFALQPRDYVFAEGRRVALVLWGTDGALFMAEPTRNLITVSESADAPSTLVLPAVERDPAEAYLVACGKWLGDKPCHDPERRDRLPLG